MTSARAFLVSLEQIGIKLGLDQIRRLVAALGAPDRAFPSIIVAGTNGKGSVTAMLERGLRAAGYRTGRYTSPHLVRLEERFAIGGDEVAPEVLDAAAGRMREASLTLPHPPSFFEATTAMALDLFRQHRVDVAVLEVGLGGRLDATNVVDAGAAAITAIDFDHEHFLGTTIEAIAFEKAGVIKPGALVVLGHNKPEAEAVIASTCEARGAHLVRSEEGLSVVATMKDGRGHLDLGTPHHHFDGLWLGLRGRHQIENAITAIRMLEEVSARGRFAISAEAIRVAVEDVRWPARLELLPYQQREVLIDGAHNPAGARALAAFIAETYGRPLPIVVGVMRDKQVDQLLAALAPVASAFIVTAPATDRAATPSELLAAAGRVAPGLRAIAVPNPVEAVALAVTMDSPIVVAGSLYLAGEIRHVLS